VSEIEAIRGVFHRYALGFDEGNFDLFARCFTQDASFETASQPAIAGREAIVQYFQGRRSARRQRGEQSRHVISNVVLLDQQDHEALAVAYVSGLLTTGPDSFSFHFGWYRDRLVKNEAGDWQIAEHFIHADGSDRPNPLLTSAQMDGGPKQ
jgi:3-phenylpropionate/cinnamic acid dioxygenase small subunit